MERLQASAGRSLLDEFPYHRWIRTRRGGRSIGRMPSILQKAMREGQRLFGQMGRAPGKVGVPEQLSSWRAVEKRARES